MSESWEVRETREADLPALGSFFREAYGEQTAFQDAGFLRWYFTRPEAPGAFESLIAVTGGGAVVAHYGGQPGELWLHGRPVSFVWGVNAFTLPAWRGGGAGRALVEQMTERHEVYGVIGFSPKTADFYADAGFNVFARERFARFVVALDESAWSVAEAIGSDGARVRELLPVGQPAPAPAEAEEIDAAMSARLDWGHPPLAEATTLRSAHHLRWRFFAHPYIAYRCLARIEGGRVRAAIFSRQERLLPTEHRVERIVDLVGDPGLMPGLLLAAAQRAREERVSFLDACTFGGLYDDGFAQAGFSVLREDAAALLPQVSSPIEARPNQEYLGLFSRRHAAEIASLRRVHFTRADSDRDRVARLSQLVAK